MNSAEKSALIAELAPDTKHTPEKIVKIAKQADGKIVFLEEGNSDSGLQHILEKHSLEFADQGIQQNQIPDAIIAALAEGKMIRYQGKWGIINGAGNIIIPNDYSFVDFLRNPKYFKVCIGEIEVVDYEDDDENYITSIKNVKWGIVDINNEIIIPIEYDWIDEVESTVWVVYKGGTVFYNDDYQEDYWTINNAKLGVYNLTKLITPIEYDVIKKNWFRIKDYIFVQNAFQIHLLHLIISLLFHYILHFFFFYHLDDAFSIQIVMPLFYLEILLLYNNNPILYLLLILHLLQLYHCVVLFVFLNYQ
jgi:hypothetical protein